MQRNKLHITIVKRPYSLPESLADFLDKNPYFAEEIKNALGYREGNAELAALLAPHLKDKTKEMFQKLMTEGLDSIGAGEELPISMPNMQGVDRRKNAHYGDAAFDLFFGEFDEHFGAELKKTLIAAGVVLFTEPDPVPPADARLEAGSPSLDDVREAGGGGGGASAPVAAAPAPAPSAAPGSAMPSASAAMSAEVESGSGSAGAGTGAVEDEEKARRQSDEDRSIAGGSVDHRVDSNESGSSSASESDEEDTEGENGAVFIDSHSAIGSSHVDATDQAEKGGSGEASASVAAAPAPASGAAPDSATPSASNVTSRFGVVEVEGDESMSEDD